jgi:hypothetical protein
MSPGSKQLQFRRPSVLLPNTTLHSLSFASLISGTLTPCLATPPLLLPLLYAPPTLVSLLSLCNCSRDRLIHFPVLFIMTLPLVLIRHLRFAFGFFSWGLYAIGIYRLGLESLS